MTDERIKNAVAEVVRGKGFGVDLLPERDGEQTPDLLATKGGQRFLIELKTKEDDSKVRRLPARPVLADRSFNRKEDGMRL